MPKVKKPKEEKVKSIKVIIDGKEFEAEARVFKTGRKGYGLYKVIKILNSDKIPYPHRISLNIMEL